MSLKQSVRVLSLFLMLIYMLLAERVDKKQNFPLCVTLNLKSLLFISTNFWQLHNPKAVQNQLVFCAKKLKKGRKSKKIEEKTYLLVFTHMLVEDFIHRKKHVSIGKSTF